MNRFGKGVTNCREETVCKTKSGWTIEGKDDIYPVTITAYIVIYSRTMRLSSPLLSCSAARAGVKSQFRAILCTKKASHFKLGGYKGTYYIFLYMFLCSKSIRITLKIEYKYI